MTLIPTKTIAGIEIAEIPGDPGGAHVMLLHGFGADFYDLIPLSGVYKKRPRPTWIFPNGPLDIPIGENWIGKAWFPIDIQRLQIAIHNKDFDDVAKIFPPEMEIIRKKLDEIVDELKIPRSKLIIGGFSQGAVLATDFALNSPTRCAALVILSGTLANQENWTNRAHLQSGLPFFQSHGIDDPLLPLIKAQELAGLLTNGGCLGNLFSFVGGHEIPSLVLSELRLFLEKVLDN